jgi:hypothetical protein
MAKKKKLDLVGLQQRVEQDMQQWLEELTIDSRVRSILDDKFKEILFKLIGFTTRFGELQVDISNGRDQHSVLGKHMQEKCSEAAKKWLDDAINPMPPLPKVAIKNLTAYYHDQLQHCLEDILDTRACEEAERIATEMIEGLVSKAQPAASIPETIAEENIGGA